MNRRLGWRAQHALALLVLAIALVVVSGVFEITNVLRIATDRARTECEIATDYLQRGITGLLEENPEATLAQIAVDRRIEQLLATFLAHARSLGAVMICDPDGVAVAHALASNRNVVIDRLPPLPDLGGFLDEADLLREVRRGTSFEMSKDIVRGQTPFASVRAHVSGTLLWDEVQKVLRRTLLTAAAVILLAFGVGWLLGRTMTEPVRILEQGVVAIREGRSEPIPETGVEMFEQLVRELNFLRDRVQMEPRVLASVGQIATGMAHEIQQPIQAIKLALNALRDARDLPGEEVAAYVETAKHAADRMYASVNGFLTVVRLKPMNVSAVDMNALLTEVRDELETEANLAGLDLDLDLDPEVVEAYADAQVLRQAVQNLVKNAIQATPSREGRVVLRSRYRAGIVQVEVLDTGPGIPENLKEKIFNFSFTTKERGTGVGLAIVRQAVEIHNGHVDLDSEVGRGTTMRIRLQSGPTPAASSRT